MRSPHQFNQFPGRSPPTAWRTLSRFVVLATAGWLLWSLIGQGTSENILPGSASWSILLAQDERPPADDKNESGPAPAAGERAGRERNAPAESPAAYRFDVPVPLRASTESLVKQRVEQVLRSLPKGGARPVFIFEFRPMQGTAGEGTEFGQAVNLARYIAGDRLAGVRTVAWVPSTVKGHAVLPILACEQIVMHKDAELGAAGINERSIDRTLRTSYNEIAERRRTVPPAIALGMLDKDLGVYKVTTADGIRYETEEGLAELREQGAVSKEDTVFQPGDHHVLSGQDMRFAHGFASHLAEDRRSLAAALQLPLRSLQQNLAPEGGWRPIRVDLSGPVHQKGVNWIIRTLDDHESQSDFNLLIFNIRSAGGNLDESRRLAEHVANLSARLHTVAYVDRQSRGDAALVAMACDELVMHPDAVVGGPGESVHREGELDAIRRALPVIYRPSGRDWSLPLAMVDSRTQVYRYTHALQSDVRYLSPEEAETLPDADRWQRDERPLDTSRGLTGLTAEEIGIARTVHNLEELKAAYQIEGALRPVRANWALAFVEWLADPRIAGMLLFVGWFALMFEMSSPGVGLPGFISALCFMLYFWSQFLHGTAGWLEILLFVGGVICLGIEIFALPGFGVFGIGGALMVVVSIVLASQTFVVPANAYQLRQFPVSLLMVAAGMAGGVASIFVIRRFLPDTPYFNRMLLTPPRADEREELSRREALVAWEHLMGKRGMTTTPLVPGGKAQFGDDVVDVISSGELIAKGTPVVVEEVAGNHVVVRKVNP
jgi:membrane-bound serine protease (ClpP class)